MSSSQTVTDAGVTTSVQKAARLFGVVFLLVGILGFVPGITSNYSSLSFAGHTSAAKLLGLFQVSILHNIVHLLFGIAGLAMSRTARGARGFLIGGGIVYLVLFVYGLIVTAMAMDSMANFVPLNNADNVLHIVLAVVMIGLGIALTRRVPGRIATTPAA